MFIYVYMYIYMMMFCSVSVGTSFGIKLGHLPGFFDKRTPYQHSQFLLCIY